VTTVHSFDERLAYSQAQSDQPWWDVVYRRAFPDLLATADLRHDGWHQRAGRDRAIVLSSGRTIYVDEKVRERDYDDVLLEVWSRYPKSGEPPYPAKRRDGFDIAGTAAGWARKPLDCDWLAYAFEQSQVCYLLPFLGVRAALENQKLGWTQKATLRADGFRWVEAQNTNYKTISVAVPIDVLRTAINNALTISWGGA